MTYVGTDHLGLPKTLLEGDGPLIKGLLTPDTVPFNLTDGIKDVSLKPM